MSMFSKFLGETLGIGPDSPETKAIEDAKRLASQNKADAQQRTIDQKAAYQESVTDAYGRQEGAYQAGSEHIQRAGGKDFQGILGSIATQAAQQRAGSGLLGKMKGGARGTQSIVDALRGVFASKQAGAQTSLARQRQGGIASLGSQRIKQAQDLRSQAFGSMTGAKQGELESTYQFGRTPLDQVVSAYSTAKSLFSNNKGGK